MEKDHRYDFMDIISSEIQPTDFPNTSMQTYISNK
jgi:hypothetical protein